MLHERFTLWYTHYNTLRYHTLFLKFLLRSFLSRIHAVKNIPLRKLFYAFFNNFSFSNETSRYKQIRTTIENAS